MCTAVTYKTQDHYFGRNLDLEYAFRETVTITPRHFPFHFSRMGTNREHYAMIGMATVLDGYPLYYEATNEAGLSMAGLNFPDIACYLPESRHLDNVAPYEFIPWILSTCATVREAKVLLEKLNLANIPFSPSLPPSPLHWILSDRECSVTVEPMKEGLRIFENPMGILTNNPPFDFHLYNLRNYLNISPEPAQNRFSEVCELNPFSNGMGGIGLPGDFSSASRFVRAAFVKLNAVSGGGEVESVSQFFHILRSVAMPRGCIRMGLEKYDITLYSSCCNTDKGIYYYTTYENSQITGIDMHRVDLDSDDLFCYRLRNSQQIHMDN